MKRRVFSIALALALCLGLLPATALAAAEEPYVVVGGLKLTVEETNDTTIAQGYYPYAYAWADETGVTLAEPGYGNVILQNWYGNLQLFLYGATIPGATKIKGQEDLSTGGIRGGAGIYCKENLDIFLFGEYGENTVTAALPEAGQAQGEVFAIYVGGNLNISSDDSGALTATSESVQYDKGSSHGIYAHGRLSVTGNAQVTARGGESTGYSVGVQALTTIEVVSNAKLTGIGGKSESCIGIVCDQLSAWNQSEVVGRAESGTLTTTGISFNSGDQHGLSVVGRSRVTAIAGGSPSKSAIGIKVPYLSSSYYNYFPIKLSKGSTELYGDEYVSEAYLEVRGTPSAGAGYAFNDDGIRLTYEGGDLIASGTTNLCDNYPGIRIANSNDHIWRTTPDGDFKASAHEGYYVYQWPYEETYLEITQGYQVTAAPVDEAMGMVTGAGWYKAGSSATVEAAPKPGYQFVKWINGDGGEVSAEASYTFDVEGDTTLTAVFEELPATGITISPASLVVAEGRTGALTPQALPDGAKLGPVTWTSSDPAVASVDENGVVTGVAAGTAVITAATDTGLTQTCTVTVNPVEDTPVRPPELPEDSNDKKLKVEVETGLSTVPEELADAGYETTDDIETELKLQIKQAGKGIPEANTAVYDVALLVSTNGGSTWQPATEDNFPAIGYLTVTLPYPRGTNDSYTFTVVHMFTTGDKAGRSETPSVTNTADGIRFKVTGLSPIVVGWTEPKPSSSGSSTSGGGSSVSTYAVAVEDADHGSVSADRKNASKGTRVTVTVKPDEGYALDTLTVTDSKGNELELTSKGDHKYTFQMPGGRVSVAAVFTPLPDEGENPCDGGADCPSGAFPDLDRRAWYHEAVDYVLSEGMMSGFGDGRFGPEETLSRAQLAQILYNREGRPTVVGSSPFPDVSDGAWYSSAVLWASGNGIVTGYGSGNFGPDDPITREQLAVMLWRYARYKGYDVSVGEDTNLLSYQDIGQLSEYAVSAMQWAVGAGVLNGYNGALSPRDNASRAQAAQMLRNFEEQL